MAADEARRRPQTPAAATWAPACVRASDDLPSARCTRTRPARSRRSDDSLPQCSSSASTPSGQLAARRRSPHAVPSLSRMLQRELLLETARMCSSCRRGPRTITCSTTRATMCCSFQSTILDALERPPACLQRGFFCVGSGWPNFAVGRGKSATGLQAEAPRLDVELLDLFDRGLLRHVHRLGDRTGDERLDRAHHRDVTAVVDRVVAHRAREHRQVLRVEARGADDRLRLVDVVDDPLDLALRSTPGCAAHAGSSG